MDNWTNTAMMRMMNSREKRYCRSSRSSTRVQSRTTLNSYAIRRLTFWPTSTIRQTLLCVNQTTPWQITRSAPPRSLGAIWKASWSTKRHELPSTRHTILAKLVNTSSTCGSNNIRRRQSGTTYTRMWLMTRLSSIRCRRVQVIIIWCFPSLTSCKTLSSDPVNSEGSANCTYKTIVAKRPWWQNDR